MDIQLVLVPYDTARRGWRSGAGPERLVAAGLPDHLRAQGHQITGTHLIEDDPSREPAEISTAFELMRRVAATVRTIRVSGAFPIILSGNCNIAVGVLSGLTPNPRSAYWFDAHGELNTPETTTSGFLDGMGLAIALGWGWRSLAESVPGFAPIPPEVVRLLGARDLDPGEVAALTRFPIACLPPSRIEELPFRIDGSGESNRLGYLHLDPDVFDPMQVGRGNTHPAANGLSLVQVTTAISAITARVRLAAITIASYAPECDLDGAISRAIFASVSTALAPRH